MMSPKSPYSILALPILEKARPDIGRNANTQRKGTYGQGDRESAIHSRVHLALADEPIAEPTEQQIKEKYLAIIVNDKVKQFIKVKEDAIEAKRKRKEKKTIHRYKMSVEGTS